MLWMVADKRPQVVRQPRDDPGRTFGRARLDCFDHVGHTEVLPFGIERLHPDDVEATRAAWRKAALDGMPIALEHRVRRADGEWRIHCHVPLFLSDLGEIGSTRADLVSTLSALRQKSRSSHLEVETYTWDVLPDHLRTGSKAADIAREISFCKKELVG